MNRSTVKVILLLSVFFMIVGCAAGDSNSSMAISNSLQFQDDEGRLLADESDFLPGSAVLINDKGPVFRSIEFQFEDSALLSDITEEFQGESIHFYYGDERVASPVIAEQINNGTVILDGGFEEELAEEIARVINDSE